MLFYEDSLNEAQAITKLGLQKKQVASIRLYESIVSIDDSLIAIIERDAMSKKELKQLLKAYVNTHHQTHHTPLKSMILSYEKQDIVLVSENCGTIKASIQKAE